MTVDIPDHIVMADLGRPYTGDYKVASRGEVLCCIHDGRKLYPVASYPIDSDPSESRVQWEPIKRKLFRENAERRTN